MKLFAIFFFVAATLFSCKKESSNYPLAELLIGKWVNEKQPLDTPEVYKENGKIIMFDNSLYFRINLAV